jgi:hypothetical protein
LQSACVPSCCNDGESELSPPSPTQNAEDELEPSVQLAAVTTQVPVTSA